MLNAILFTFLAVVNPYERKNLPKRQLQILEKARDELWQSLGVRGYGAGAGWQRRELWESCQRAVEQW